MTNRGMTKREVLLEELAKEDLQILALAYVYAKNSHMYGIDVTEKWLTAIENSRNLELAYRKGYYEALQRTQLESDKSKCTKKNCPMNAETLNPECDLKNCPYRTEVIGDLISREQAINELKLAYFDKDLQNAKDDPCIVDAMTDWAIRTIKRLPSVTLDDRGDSILNDAIKRAIKSLEQETCEDCIRSEAVDILSKLLSKEGEDKT